MDGPANLDRYVGQEIRHWREVRAWSRLRLAAEMQGQPDVRLVRLAEDQGTTDTARACIPPDFREGAARALGMSDASLLSGADDRCMRDLIPNLRRDPHGADGGRRRAPLPSGGCILTRLGQDGDEAGRWFADRYDAQGTPSEILPL